MVDNCVSVVTKLISCLTKEYVGDNPYDGNLDYELSILEKVLGKMNIHNITLCVNFNHCTTILALLRTLNIRDSKLFKLEKSLGTLN